MNDVIAATVQQTGGRLAAMGHYVKTSWTLLNAVIAVVAGLSTLNIAVADSGMATINEVASPMIQQFARFGRQA